MGRGEGGGTMIDTIRKMLAPVQRRVMLMVSRAVVNIVDDSLNMQNLQLTVLVDETQDGVERFQNFGFTSVPSKGAEAIVLNVGGNRDHPIAVVVDDRRYRLKNLQEGESAVHNKDGDKVHIKQGREINVVAGDATHDGTVAISALGANGKATISAPGTNGKAKVVAKLIELLSADDSATEALAQKILNGTNFRLWADAHIHTGGFVSPTSPPTIPTATYDGTLAAVSSETVKASP